MKSEILFGQPSLGFSSDSVDAWITPVGGQIAPVTFHLPNGDVQPFSIAPWGEEVHNIEPILQVLRGDFFCLPFGGNEVAFGPEKYPIHGETANEKWHVVDHQADEIRMSMDTQIRKGHLTKRVWTRSGQAAVYQRHVIQEMTGPMCLGHHAMVKFSSVGNISLGPFSFGQVFPGIFELPAVGGYSSLKPGSHFRDLHHVPSSDGSFADLSQYPAREGFEDLVMVYAEKGSTFGWSAVTFPDEGYIWFSLKDPRMLSGTILWHSNGGRHYAPWSGRHRHVLGIEEVTSYMHYGLAGSVAENDASKEGYRTYLDLTPDSPLVINTIMGVAPCPSNAERVQNISATQNGIRITMDSGVEIDVILDIAELYQA